jgi:hypothetical protein
VTAMPDFKPSFPRWKPAPRLLKEGNWPAFNAHSEDLMNVRLRDPILPSKCRDPNARTDLPVLRPGQAHLGQAGPAARVRWQSALPIVPTHASRSGTSAASSPCSPRSRSAGPSSLLHPLASFVPSSVYISPLTLASYVAARVRARLDCIMHAKGGAGGTAYLWDWGLKVNTRGGDSVRPRENATTGMQR